jgi:hypothetical protein
MRNALCTDFPANCGGAIVHTFGNRTPFFSKKELEEHKILVATTRSDNQPKAESALRKFGFKRVLSYHTYTWSKGEIGKMGVWVRVHPKYK